MKEYEGLTPAEAERYEKLIEESYPHPTEELKEAVMARIAEERARRRRRMRGLIKWGGIAACFVIICTVAVSVLPSLSRNLAKKSDEAANTAYCNDDVLTYECDAVAAVESESIEGATFGALDADDADASRDERVTGSAYGFYLSDGEATDDGFKSSLKEENGFPQNSAPAAIGLGDRSDNTQLYNRALNALCVNSAISETDALSLEYARETYDIAYLGSLVGDAYSNVEYADVEDWKNAVYMNKSDEERASTPTLYQAVHDLGIEKNEFISVNSTRRDSGLEYLSVEIIDALYLEEDEMKEALANSNALYYNGEIYTLNDIGSMTVEDVIDAGIPEDVINEYVESVIIYCVDNEIITEGEAEEYYSVGMVRITVDE